MARSRGGSKFKDPSGTLPPDSPIDVLDDLPARDSGSVGWLPLAGSRGAVRQLGRERLPARQVLRLPRSREPLLLQELRKLRFSAPAAVRACVQRKRRREVLFARRKAGFSGSAVKKHWRRTVNSQYRC